MSMVVSPSVTAKTGKDDSSIETAERTNDKAQFRSSASSPAKNLFGNEVIEIDSDNQRYEEANGCWNQAPDMSDEEEAASDNEDIKVRHNETDCDGGRAATAAAINGIVTSDDAATGRDATATGGGAATAAAAAAHIDDIVYDADDADDDPRDAAAARAAAIAPVSAGDIPFTAAIVAAAPAGTYTLKTFLMSSSTTVLWKKTADDLQAPNRCFAVTTKSGDAVSWCMLPKVNKRACGDCWVYQKLTKNENFQLDAAKAAFKFHGFFNMKAENPMHFLETQRPGTMFHEPWKATVRLRVQPLTSDQLKVWGEGIAGLLTAASASMKFPSRFRYYDDLTPTHPLPLSFYLSAPECLRVIQLKRPNTDVNQLILNNHDFAERYFDSTSLTAIKDSLRGNGQAPNAQGNLNHEQQQFLNNMMF